MPTNAVRFGDDRWFEQYQRTPCSGLGISIKSVGKEMTAKVLRRNDWERIALGIRRAMNFHDIGVSTVLNSMISLDELWQIATWAHENGANQFTLSLCSATLNSDGSFDEDHFMVNDETLQKFSDVYWKISELYDDNMVFEPELPFCMLDDSFVEKLIEKGQFSNGCFLYEKNGFAFDKDANVTLCNAIYHEPVAVYGRDFDDEKSLIAHMNSPKVTELYEDLCRYPSDECPRCRWKQYCRGGCVVNWTMLDAAICQAR
jgi:radical SAM protein with 4Fe4S-binding SPASM domain